MKLKYLIYTITLTGLTACGDFLEPKSQSQYIPKDANALQEMLIGEAYPQQKDTKCSSEIECCDPFQMLLEESFFRCSPGKTE